VWSPAVPACRNCPEPPAFIAKTGIYPVHIDGMTCDPPCKDGPCGSATAMSLAIPAEMTRPHYERHIRLEDTKWTEVWKGLQVRWTGAWGEEPAAAIVLRLTPPGNDPGPIEMVR
jgi:hypothetical protein